jgi:hypothetical protein
LLPAIVLSLAAALLAAGAVQASGAFPAAAGLARWADAETN